MKAKTPWQTIKVNLFAVAVLVTCGFAAAANAQTSNLQPTDAIKFTLPFEVYWGKSVLPAGRYTMSMDARQPVALVQSANGKTSFFTPIPIKDRSGKGPAALIVVVRGNERMVRSLNLPEHHMSLIYKPATLAESEILAKADQVRAVPLISAGK
jgi:hypothetical protein